MANGGERGGRAARPDVSVVVPVYRCSPCLRPLRDRVTAALEPLVDSFEIILVDDRGGDGAWEVISELAARDARVRGVRLSRNFGQHAAITAGLAAARGDWALVMDCDLQDPPEEIPRLWAKASEGYDIVYGRRSSKPTSLPRRLAARAYFKGINVFSGADVKGEFGTFSLISRVVIDGFLRFRDRDRHYILILHWLGHDWAAVDYQPSLRHEGESSYSFARLVRHALDGVFFQTTVLLRWIVYLGFCIALVGAILATYFAGARVLGTAYPGWTSIAVILLLGIGFIITSTGITGLYIGKVFEQVKDRPLYVVDRTVGDSEPVVKRSAGAHDAAS
jgi:glycosyltransferase involved in cell wall biosynthesis